MARTEGSHAVKRPSIADLAPRKGPPPAADPAPVAETVMPSHAPRAGKEQAPYKAVLAKVDEDTHRALKILSANEDVPIGDLLVEGLNLLFRNRGLPEIATKVTPDETGKRR